MLFSLDLLLLAQLPFNLNPLLDSALPICFKERKRRLLAPQLGSEPPTNLAS